MAYAPDMRMGENGGYPDPSQIQDVIDHPDMDLPDPGHSPRPVHSTKMAGDVIQVPTMVGAGQTDSSVDYATGKKTAPNVKSIGMDKLKSWADRTSKR